MWDWLTAPWQNGGWATFGLILWMGFLVNATCGLVGNFLILRRMALVGDAISHSILPGVAVAFLVAHSLETPVMVVGAIISGLLATALIEFIHGRTKVKADAAIGITFTTMFAIGVIVINLFAGKIHLDPDCVLYGDINMVAFEVNRVTLLGLPLGPKSVALMLGIFIFVVLVIAVFYKELLLSSFDSGLAEALGFSPRLIHYVLMAVLSLVVVGAFEAVGAILVIAMLILPGATSQLLSTRLPIVLLISVGVAGVSALGGLYMGVWWDLPIAPAMVVAGLVVFLMAWLLAPSQGLVWVVWRRLRGISCDEDAEMKNPALLEEEQGF